MTRLALDAAAARVPTPEGARSAALFEHGTLVVKIYAPRGADPQQPHTRDEIYAVARGSGTFACGDERTAFQPGDVLFAPAGAPHRFENFTDDFVTWVFFYGLEGGEAALGTGVATRAQVEAAVAEYVEALNARDRERWLAALAEGVRHADPVGDPMRVGRDAVGRFWDYVFAQYDSIDLDVTDRFITGSEAALVWTITGHKGARRRTFSGVDVLEVDAGGKIVLVRAYWDRARMSTWEEP